MQTLRGLVRGNTVAVYDDDISAYDGREVKITVLEEKAKAKGEEARRAAAYDHIQQFRGIIHKDIDLKKALAEALDERFARTT